MIAAEDVADALLSGPWRREPMRIRVTRLAGLILVPPWIDDLVTVLLRAHPSPPPRAVVEALLRTLRLGEYPADLDSLARLLDVDSGELAWFADVGRWTRRTAAAPLHHYRWRTVPKRGGVRLVAVPKPRLKEMQRRVLRHVVAPIPVHPAAHGCVPGRSVRSAVAEHAGSDMLIRADLESFFASISASRVGGVLRRAGVPGAVARAITGLCTTVVPLVVWRSVPVPADPAGHYRLGRRLAAPHLPTGAPTSPALANLVAYSLDRRLAGLAASFGGRYTRYVDDLLFSGDARLRNGRAAFVRAVAAVVDDSGFRLAERKTVVLGSAGRQQALGAVVNDHPTLARRDRDNLRALLHNCAVHGPSSQSRGREHFREHLLGRISAVAGLDPELGIRLRGLFDRIGWTP